MHGSSLRLGLVFTFGESEDFENSNYVHNANEWGGGEILNKSYIHARGN